MPGAAKRFAQSLRRLTGGLKKCQQMLEHNS
ncbi:hypothetical protein AGR1B_Lc50287 [Agrobacterium fabacearum S56]|nr:hypothetical protein AGR1B_Lc50287 [Agrobacterium fabacearum S56]CUX36580.1 hypothetical protein AGR4B_Lc20010 [Agrobacterium tumefaciens str. CFBP 5621]